MFIPTFSFKFSSLVFLLNSSDFYYPSKLFSLLSILFIELLFWLLTLLLLMILSFLKFELKF